MLKYRNFKNYFIERYQNADFNLSFKAGYLHLIIKLLNKITQKQLCLGCTNHIAIWST